MINVSVARRYARALLEAVAGGDSEAVAAQLERIAEAGRLQPELHAFFANPTYTRAQQHAVIDGLIQALGLEADPLPRFLRLLVDRRRLAALSDIALVFRDLADARAGRIRGKVVSAVPLAEPVLRELEKTLGEVTHARVLLEAEVDPSVIGGISAQVGSVLYDGTLRTELDEIRRALKR